MIEEIVLDERNKINYSGKDLLASYACRILFCLLLLLNFEVYQFESIGQ